MPCHLRQRQAGRRPASPAPAARSLRSSTRQLPVEEVDHQPRDLVTFVFECEVPGIEQMQLGLGQVPQVWVRALGADALLALIGEQIANLITQEDAALIRECGGSACTLWFLDRTKAHRRLYCSASTCGNRAKVAAFRERQRG
jgi:predicted RNA-binding Zn ribbon-like protein